MRSILIIIFLLFFFCSNYTTKTVAGIFGYDSFSDCMIGEMKGQNKSMEIYAFRKCLKKFPPKKKTKEQLREDKLERQSQEQQRHNNAIITCEAGSSIRNSISLKIARDLLGIKFSITNNSNYKIKDVIIEGGQAEFLVKLSTTLGGLLPAVSPGFQIAPYQTRVEILEAPEHLSYGIKSVTIVGRRTNISRHCS